MLKSVNKVNGKHMNFYTTKLFVLSTLFILIFNGCAKSQEEKELKNLRQ